MSGLVAIQDHKEELGKERTFDDSRNDNEKTFRVDRDKVLRIDRYSVLKARHSFLPETVNRTLAGFW